MPLIERKAKLKRLEEFAQFHRHLGLGIDQFAPGHAACTFPPEAAFLLDGCCPPEIAIPILGEIPMAVLHRGCANRWRDRPVANRQAEINGPITQPAAPNLNVGGSLCIRII